MTELQIINSMLWSAYGDVLGFPTELTDEKGLAYRTWGQKSINAPVPWRRKIGGLFGTSINLPQGIYSDDTQLRLAVCRSINNNGSFDYEAFSKIEMPVFLTYGLGVGKGTREAGQSLQKKTIQWNTNFFNTKQSVYIWGGGNGASIRIQPHVWSAQKDKSIEYIISEIMKDTIITHGHPTGWIGAVFHGLFLHEALNTNKCPSPDEWERISEPLKNIPDICRQDMMLNDIWISTWENKTGSSFEESFSKSLNDFFKDLNTIISLVYENYRDDSLKDDSLGDDLYYHAVEIIDAKNPKYRGSATITALLASLVAYHYSQEPEKGILECVNSFGTDTDSIASMAGAIMGSYTEFQPNNMILDQEYLILMAKRMYKIHNNERVENFPYPDLLLFNLPKNQIDYVTKSEDGFYLIGFGKIKLMENQDTNNKIEFSNDITKYGFFKTTFGQSLLLKYKSTLMTPSNIYVSVELKKSQINEELKKNIDITIKKKNIDEITSEIIKNGFNPYEIGEALLSLATEDDCIEKSIAFSAIIIKAKKARLKKDI